MAGLTLSILALAVLSACAASGPAAAPDRSVASLRLIGQQILPRRSDYEGTVVGGLSGVDYDAANNRFVFLSDDRSSADSANPPRLYTAVLTYDANSFSAVRFTSTVTMKRPDGSVYPKLPDAHVADPEGVRVDTTTGNLLWVSEGDRTLTSTPPRLVDPFVREIRPNGTHVREYALPAMFAMSAGGTGPRGNLVFEGITFTPDRSRAVVIAEGPLQQDGPVPTTTAGAVARITVFDRADGVARAQYAYPVERVQAAPVPADQFAVNGATEILAVTNRKFLVLERSFSVGVAGHQVRLYEIDTSDATDVLPIDSLAGATYTPVTKRLVLDFETLQAALGGIGNLEGIAFGPKLADGRDSLVVVADDNFATADSATDRNQIVVFEVR